MIDYLDSKILNVNKYLFLAKDSNSFFDKLRGFKEWSGKEKIQKFEEIKDILNKHGILYNLVIIPDRIIFLKYMFDESFFNLNSFNTRPAILFSQTCNFISYSVTDFGRQIESICEKRDTHLTYGYLLQYVYSHINPSLSESLKYYLKEIEAWVQGYGGDLYDMLSPDDQKSITDEGADLLPLLSFTVLEERLKNFPSYLVENKKLYFTYQSSGEKILSFLKLGYPNSIFQKNDGDVDVDEIIQLQPQGVIHLLTEKFFN
jgi:hypothetical protein